MAKISAGGDRETHRWRRESDGAELLLTERGRLLHKVARKGRWKLLMHKVTDGYAEAQASERGMNKVV